MAREEEFRERKKEREVFSKLLPATSTLDCFFFSFLSLSINTRIPTTSSTNSYSKETGST